MLSRIDHPHPRPGRGLCPVGVGVPAFVCKLGAPCIVPSAAAWGWASATTSPEAGELSPWDMRPQGRPCPLPIHPAARRTITSLAPASSVRLRRSVRNEPSSMGPAWPPSHPARGAGTAPYAWPSVPRHPLLTRHRLHFGSACGAARVAGAWGDGALGVERRIKVDGEESVPSPASPPPAWCLRAGGHAVTHGDVSSFALLLPPWELSAGLGLISLAPSNPRSLSLCLAPPSFTHG